MANNTQKNIPNPPKSTHDVLQQKGFAAEASLMSRKTVTTAVEEGKKYSLELGSAKPSVIYKVDGHIVTTGNKCDRLVLVKTAISGNKDEWTEIFVEQKGTNVKHAYEQLRDSVKLTIFHHASNTARRACVVAANFPANNSDPAIEKIKKELAVQNITCKQFKNGQKDSLC